MLIKTTSTMSAYEPMIPAGVFQPPLPTEFYNAGLRGCEQVCDPNAQPGLPQPIMMPAVNKRVAHQVVCTRSGDPADANTPYYRAGGHY